MKVWIIYNPIFEYDEFDQDPATLAIFSTEELAKNNCKDGENPIEVEVDSKTLIYLPS